MTKTEEIGNVLQQVSVDQYEILLENDYPEPQYLVKIRGIGTFPLGDIAACKAKSKNGKTIAVSIIGASIHGSDVFGIESQARGSTVLYFDTEQNERNTARVLRRMNALCGYSSKVTKQEIRAFSIRRIDTELRWSYIVEQVNKRKPSAVIIDGIVDLVKDFNDPVESKEFVSKLLQFAAEQNILIICVLHTNKAKDDNNMRGHLGTILEQKAADIFEVVKNGHTFTVKQTESRNQPVDEFSFVLDNDGMPRPISLPARIPHEKELVELREFLPKAFGDRSVLQRNALERAYGEVSGKGSTTCSGRINLAVQYGLVEPVIISENGSKRYYKLVGTPAGDG